MSNEKLLTALTMAAICAIGLMQTQAARAAGQDGIVVVRDAQTGQLRAPTADEMKALTQVRPGALKAQPPLSSLVTKNPDGSRRLRLGERGQVFTVVTRGPDGTLAEQCVQGDQAAAQALAQPVPASQTKEPRHEDR